MNDTQKAWNKIVLNSEYPRGPIPASLKLFDPNLAKSITDAARATIRKAGGLCESNQE